MEIVAEEKDEGFEVAEKDRYYVLRKSREWIRITEIARECDDKDLKERMLEECPALQQRFGAVGMEHFIMFKVEVENVEMK